MANVFYSTACGICFNGFDNSAKVNVTNIWNYAYSFILGKW